MDNTISFPRAFLAAGRFKVRTKIPGLSILIFLTTIRTIKFLNKTMLVVEG
jgi:hypothetical protein